MPGRSSSGGSGLDTYKYTGHERDDEAGLGLIYAGARYMDPVIGGRWLSIDPLASKYPSWSPYNYVMNNPVNAFDPDGRDVWFVHGTFSSSRTWDNSDENDDDWDTKWAYALNDQNAGRFNWRWRSKLNTTGSRKSAARSLARKIKEAYDKNREMLVQLVAHSHGGNVAIETANILYEKYGIRVDRLVLLGTPSRGDFTIDEGAVVQLYNIWDGEDWIQRAGGIDSPFGNPYNLRMGIADRERPEDENAIEVEVIDANGNHHSLHTKQEIIDWINEQLYNQKQ